MTSRDSPNICSTHTSTVTVCGSKDPSQGSSDSVFWLDLTYIKKWEFLQEGKVGLWLTRGPVIKYVFLHHLTNKTLLLIRRVTYHSFPEILYLNLLRCYKSSSKDFQRLWARPAAENPKRRDWQYTEIQTSPPLRPVLSVTSYRFSVCNIQMPWQVLILTKFQETTTGKSNLLYGTQDKHPSCMHHFSNSEGLKDFLFH